MVCFNSFFYSLPSNRIHNLKYLKLTTSGCKDVEIRKKDLIHNQFKAVCKSPLINLLIRNKEFIISNGPWTDKSLKLKIIHNISWQWQGLIRRLFFGFMLIQLWKIELTDCHSGVSSPTLTSFFFFLTSSTRCICFVAEISRGFEFTLYNVNKD